MSEQNELSDQSLSTDTARMSHSQSNSHRSDSLYLDIEPTDVPPLTEHPTEINEDTGALSVRFSVIKSQVLT